MFFGLAILCFAAVPTALSEKLHERMTIEQVAEIFQTPHELVPDYEVVRFHGPRLNKRDTKTPQQLTVKAFGENIKLWLTLNDGFLAGKNTLVYTAKRDPKGNKIVYKEIPDAIKKAGKIMEDPAKKASLLVKTDSKGLYSMNGFIDSKNLVIRSLPDSISHDLMQNRSFQDSESLESSRTARSTYHVVFKKKAKYSEGSYKSLGFNDTRSRVSRALHATPPIPNVLFPEIMVVIDYNLFSLTGKSIDKILNYALAFWNGVDLLYRSFDHPQFRFNIARFIIAEEDKATPYIANSMFDNELIDAYKALDLTQHYYFSILKTFPTDSYDAVMTMTSLEMTSGDGDPDTLGIAGAGAACNVDERRKVVRTVAITTDDGSFSGVSTAAHEFAHLLGAGHDSDKPNCLATDGYIMTDETTVTENSHDFSPCTIKEIQTFLSKNRATCFYNKPKITDPLPRILPGFLSDRDHQCETLQRGKNCYTGHGKQLRCSAIYCLDPEDPKECEGNKSFMPPDGAFCDKGKVCLHGKCVAL